MSTRAFAGRCYCGRIRYTVGGEILSLCYCHCESCRRATGAPFVAWGTVDRSNFEITSGGLSFVRLRAEVERGFCGACGSQITYSHTARAGKIDFTLATLEEPEALRPTRHIWVQDKLRWVQISDELPQYLTVSGA
jgi:hypothetical protein